MRSYLVSFLILMFSSVAFAVTGNVSVEGNIHTLLNNSVVSPQLIVEQAGTGDSALLFFHSAATAQSLSIGLDQNDNKNLKISNTNALTGTTYGDANTMLRVHTETGSQGILDINHQSRARAFRNTSTQAKANNSWEKVQFNGKTYDEKSEFDSVTNYRFTALIEGYYQVNSRVKFNVTTAPTLVNSYVTIAIYVNGVAYSNGAKLAVRADATRNVQANDSPVVNDVVYLTAGQYIEIFAFQNSGAAQTIQDGAAETYVSIHKIS